MGKDKRLMTLRSKSEGSFADKASKAFTRSFQKELRNSELWDEIVAQLVEDTRSGNYQ